MFLVIQDNFKRDEVETMAEASEKWKKPGKMPVRSKDIGSMLHVGNCYNSWKLSQITELTEIDRI